MIVDCHVHSCGEETAADVLKGMDAAGVDRILLMSYEYITDEKDLWPELERLSKLCAEAPDRLYSLATVDPRFPSAPGLYRRAVEELGYKGLKMLPNHWYPYDDCAMRMYEVMQELETPGIFHSGILYGQIYLDSSRFCRPAYFEAVIHYPKARFALAHIGWPWCEECTAVFGRFRNWHHRGGAPKPQMFIDLTPGGWTVDQLKRTIDYAGADSILYGSDTNTKSMDHLKNSLEKHRRIFDELELPKEDQAKMLGRNVMT